MQVRKFRMSNTSTQAATFSFDKALLDAWGIKVDPESVSKLPGSPENGSVEISVTLKVGLGLGLKAEGVQ